MSVNNPSKLCQPQLPQLYYNSPQTQEVITINVVENNLTDSDYAVVEKTYTDIIISLGVAKSAHIS